jgi:hypothetical protein
LESVSSPHPWVPIRATDSTAASNRFFIGSSGFLGLSSGVIPSVMECSDGVGRRQQKG